MVSQSDQTDQKAKQKEENRRAFPETARVVDEFRAVFGPGVKLIWASENGREVGRKDKK